MQRHPEGGRMSQSLSAQFLHSDVNVDCLECEHPIWVQWSEIVAQSTILCPCGRLSIRLVDGEGGVQKLGADLERQPAQALKGLPW